MLDSYLVSVVEQAKLLGHDLVVVSPEYYLTTCLKGAWVYRHGGWAVEIPVKWLGNHEFDRIKERLLSASELFAGYTAETKNVDDSYVYCHQMLSPYYTTHYVPKTLPKNMNDEDLMDYNSYARAGNINMSMAVDICQGVADTVVDDGPSYNLSLGSIKSQSILLNDVWAKGIVADLMDLLEDGEGAMGIFKLFYHRDMILRVD